MYQNMRVEPSGLTQREFRRIHIDPDGDPEDPACPWLNGAYVCATAEEVRRVPRERYLRAPVGWHRTLAAPQPGGGVPDGAHVVFSVAEDGANRADLMPPTPLGSHSMQLLDVQQASLARSSDSGVTRAVPLLLGEARLLVFVPEVSRAHPEGAVLWSFIPKYLIL